MSNGGNEIGTLPKMHFDWTMTKKRRKKHLLTLETARIETPAKSTMSGTAHNNNKTKNLLNKQTQKKQKQNTKNQTIFCN